MCGRFELKTKFEKLPKVLKQDYPGGLDTKYNTQVNFAKKDNISLTPIKLFSVGAYF